MVLEGLYSKIQSKVKQLSSFVEKVEKEDDAYNRAYQVATKGTEFLKSLQDDVEQAETVVSIEHWPLPTYDQLLLEI